MAENTTKIPPYSCIYCDPWVEFVRAIFAEHKGRGWAYVVRQPETPEEIRLAMEAVESCPTDSIGTDGDRQ